MSDIQRAVVGVFAALTRYPEDLLVPDADLEADLGIDSVKRNEIVAALQHRFGLPRESITAGANVRTIAAVATLVERAMGQGETAPVSQPAPRPIPPPAPPAVATQHRDGLSWAAAAPQAPRPMVPPAPVAAPPPVHAPRRAADAGDLRRDVLSTLREVVDEALQRQDGGFQRGRAVAPAWASASPFAGKIALVTGSGHGLGRVIAQRLARAGCRLIINSFHARDQGEQTAADIVAEGGEAIHLWGSVAQREHLERIFGEIDASFGGLDFLVSNASNGIIAPLSQVEEIHWERSFKTNVVGLHRATMLAAPLMARRGGGRVVTISSPGADRYIEHFGCQGPVKAALESLVRYLAVELGPQNIQVNALSAGPVYGDLLSRYPDQERLIPYWESRTTTGRLASEEDMAEAVLWLLSPQARPVNGATLLADYTGSLRI